MKTFLPLTLSLLSATALAASPGSNNNSSANHSTALTFNVDLGAEYDSNVNIVEIDATSNQSDMAAVLNAGANLQWKPGNAFTLKSGLAYSNKQYQDVQDFDVAILRGFVEASYDFHWLNLGASYHRADADVASEPFLNLTQKSIYASRLFGEQLYVRLASVQKEKQYDNAPDRDSNSDGFDADLYVFFNAAKSFIAFGVATEDELALDPQYSNDGFSIKARFSNKFKLGSMDAKFQMGWRYSERDYVGVTPEIDATRFDKRHVLDAEWEMHWNEHVGLSTRIERGDYRSNLSAANYDEFLASITIKTRF